MSTTHVLSSSERGGVIFMAVIGCISTISLLALLVHIISVSFLPLCLSAFNIRSGIATIFHTSSSTGISNSADQATATGPHDSKVHHPRPDSTFGIHEEVDLERARALAERRSRARASEMSRQRTKYNEEKMFLRMQLGVFILCMLLSDLIQSIGVLVQIRWAAIGKVEPGNACWVQAAMITFGDVSTACWNAIIAVHTFCTIVLGIRMSVSGIVVVVIAGWTFPILMNVIGSVVVAKPDHDYYDVAGAWCFISNPYYKYRVGLHYVPLLLSALIITVMYTLVSLTMRGNLQITQVSTSRIPRFSVTFRRTTIHNGTTGNTNQKQVAYLRALSLKMLWYPIAYICLILPISICRMVELKGKKAPFPLLFFAMTLLFLVGISNVAIYLTTRNLGAPRRPADLVTRTQTGRGTQMEIYIDRITQHDAEVVTAGGTGRDKPSAIRFEDLSMDDLKSGNAGRTDDDSSSFEEGRNPMDGKTPASAAFMTGTSTPNSSHPLYRGEDFDSPAYPPTQPARSRHRSQAGSVIIERVGDFTMPGRDTPFEESLVERQPIETINENGRNPFGSTSAILQERSHIVINSRPHTAQEGISRIEAQRRSTSWQNHSKSQRSFG